MISKAEGDINKRDAYDNDEFFFEYPFHKVDISLLKRSVEEMVLNQRRVVRDMIDETKTV